LGDIYSIFPDTDMLFHHKKDNNHQISRPNEFNNIPLLQHDTSSKDYLHTGIAG